MGIFPDLDEDTLFLSRANPDENLGTFSEHSFVLEDREWPSVEHYFQAMKFSNESYQEKIRQAQHPKVARKLGRTRLKRIRSDWAEVKEVIMTRGVYIKCRTHQNVADELIASAPNKIMENSQYDYYWGCGRDRRGHNHYGKILMAVRNKLLSEQG